MCWLTVGLLLGKPGSKLVHVLISLLSNQVENKSGVSGWLGEWGKRFPCFPRWGISVSKNKYTCILLHNRHNFSLVVCCRAECVLCIGRGWDVLSLLKLLLTCTLENAFLENVFHDAGLVFRGHSPVFFVLLVVSYPKWKLRWFNKYSVGFISCSLGLLLNCISNFVLCWNRFETCCIGCTMVLLTKVCTLACKKKTANW